MSKYTPELAESIAESVANGTPVTIAAQAHGIGRKSFYRWMEEHESFKAVIEQKRAQAIRQRVERIKEAGVKGTWTADAWWLERQKPEEFGAKPERKDINITVTIRDCSQDADPRLPEPEPVELLECLGIDGE